ncbi:MAG: PKD domain-containing protein [Eudoraea sp.]|nr:PKD domain-containing protein [Eudoraea sp.]
MIFSCPAYLRILTALALLFSVCLHQDLYAQIDFTKNELNFGGQGNVSAGVTSLMYGPDGRLYVAEYPGTIKIFTIQRNGPGNYVVTDVEQLSSVTDIVNHDDDGVVNNSETQRETTGLTVAGTAANPVIYVTSSDFRIGSGFGGGNGDLDLDTNSGIITRISWNGNFWETVDLVRGLPRSEENHATNGLEFTAIKGVDYLIVASGGITNAGSPSTNFVYTCEYALSGAVLSVNLDILNGMTIKTDGNGRNYIYDLPTLDDPSRANVNGITDPDDPAYNGVDINDPFGGNDGLNQAMIVPGGPVQIFSPGYRNAYDLVVTESGAVYVTDNGANVGWGGFPVNEGGGGVTNAYDANEPGSSNPTADGEKVNNEDHLELITNDLQNYNFGSFYGGHPNPTRANPAAAGLYTAPNILGTQGAVFRTTIYDPDGSTPGSTTNAAIALPANWPPVQTANGVEGDWRGPGISNPDGADDNPVTTWGTNTNGIDEYTASNFGGAMQGDLLAGHNNGILRRVELNANGSLNQLTSNFLTGIGGNALGVSCNSDDEVFPGTIWIGTLNGKIVVFEPGDYMEEPPTGPNFPLRINAGGQELTHDGELFFSDQFFQGGIPFSNMNAQVPEMFQTERTASPPTFDYQIPVPNGNYTVILHFAEIYWGATGGGPEGIGQRIFDVSIENSLVLDNYDINADVGPETPVSKSFNIAISDEELNINFSALTADGGVNQPKVSAIEIFVSSSAPPVAVASATPTSGTVPLEVSFTGDNSTDDEAVISYLWDFQDGSPVTTVANPVHTFTIPGTYMVELTVEDEEGQTDTAILSISVSDMANTSPVAVASANPVNGVVPLEVTFTGDGSTDDVAVVSYQWDFKDGSPISSVANPTHIFEATGTYEVELTVADGEGLTDSITITIVVSVPGNVPPVAVVSATPINGEAPLQVNFTGSNSTDDVAVVSYLWDFDDGTATSTEEDPSHTFTNAGIYDVSLTVEDSEGLEDSASVSIVVVDLQSAKEIDAMIIVNPAKEIAQVRLIDNGPADRRVVEISLHDSGGRLIDVYNPGELFAHGLFEIPVSTLSDGGVYYIGFEMNRGERIVLSLIVKH